MFRKLWSFSESSKIMEQYYYPLMVNQYYSN